MATELANERGGHLVKLKELMHPTEDIVPGRIFTYDHQRDSTLEQYVLIPLDLDTIPPKAIPLEQHPRSDGVHLRTRGRRTEPLSEVTPVQKVIYLLNGMLENCKKEKHEQQV